MRRIYIFSILLYVIIFTGFAERLNAHHQLGLPHYLYSKEYPQIPTMLIEADAEGYIVSFSTYPGNPKPGDIVRLKIYIKNKITGKAFLKPITMSINSVYFFFMEKEIASPITLNQEFNEYKASYTFNNTEKYNINVTFEPRPGFFEKIPFPLIIGRTNFSLIPVVSGVIFLIIFIIVGIKKKKSG